MSAITDPELNLAIACCRWSYSGQSAGEIQRLCSDIDWGRLVHVINRHRVQGLVGAALRSNGIMPPEPFGAEISRDTVANAEHNLRSAVECERLIKGFSEAGVDILFVKGLSLSALAYGDPFLKMSTDIDILIEQETVAETADILTAMGYRLNAPPVHGDTSSFVKWHKRQKESAWKHLGSGFDVDLHTALSDNPSVIPGIGMASPRQMVPITRTLSLPTLTTPDLFTYLCVHGTWSAWYRLKWIVDVAALVQRAGAGDAAQLYDYAKERGAGRAPAQALFLAHKLFGSELPPSVRQEMERDPVARLLANLALRQLRLYRPPNERRLGTLPLHLARPLFRPGLKWKISEIKRQLHDVAQRVTMRH